MKTVADMIIECGIEPPVYIMYKVAIPSEFVDEEENADTLFGYCVWDGSELVSLDDGDYFLDDEVIEASVITTESGEEYLSVTLPEPEVDMNLDWLDDFETAREPEEGWEKSITPPDSKESDGVFSPDF